MKDYNEQGYLIIVNIFENGNVALSNSYKGGLRINFSEDFLIPNYDDNLLSVLENKEKERDMLSEEICNIRQYLSEASKYALQNGFKIIKNKEVDK